MRKLMIPALLLVSFSSLAAGPIETRKENFKEFKKHFGAIKKIVTTQSLDKQGQLQAEVQALISAADKQWNDIAAHFPVGSDKGDTDASSEIWTDFDGFKAAAQKQRDALAAFAVTVQNKDAKAWQEGFGQVGGTCKNCHENFKKE